MSDPQQAGGLAVVIDTNFLLAHLPWLSLMSKAANQFQITLVVPYVVVTELDSLKTRLRTNEDGLDVGAAARAAVRFLHRVLQTPFSPFRGQTLHEASHLEGDPSLVINNDDRILQCCLQMARQYGAERCLLLSNDKGLCVKGMMNHVLTAGWGSLPPLLLHCAQHAHMAPDCMEEEASVEDRADPAGWLPNDHSMGGSGAWAEAVGVQAEGVARLLASLRLPSQPPAPSLAHSAPPPHPASTGGEAAGRREAGGGGEEEEEERWKDGEDGGVVARARIILPPAYSEAWTALRAVVEPLGAEVVAPALEAAFGAEWHEAAGAAPPWQVGDTLHVARKHWRTLLQPRCSGLHVRCIARLQDGVRVLRRGRGLTVGEALALLSDLRRLATAAQLPPHCAAHLEDTRSFLRAKALLLPLPDPPPDSDLAPPHPHRDPHPQPLPASAPASISASASSSASAPSEAQRRPAASGHAAVSAGGPETPSHAASTRVAVVLPGQGFGPGRVELERHWHGGGVGVGPGEGGPGPGPTPASASGPGPGSLSLPVSAGQPPSASQPLPSPTAMMCD